MSDTDSDAAGSEPDLETLSRRAAEARLLRDAEAGPARLRAGSSGSEDGDATDSGPPDSPEEEILWAAERGLCERVSQLLKEDPSLIGARDGDGYTPLHRAAYNDHVAVVERLLSAGADLSARTAEGWTPLHSAARWNSAGCLPLLVLHGADVNAPTAGGLTPLMVAASSGEARDTCYLLLTTDGVRLEARNDSGDTAADIGRRTAAIQPLFELTEPYMTDI
ncbi:ankyrin repeat domain-containing protein 49-like [Amphibalanus amphitrite]|nr:ankyrin repeat domain-containing protein 49-like [Amphibalanus amphitrite]XP_043195782.1 ankyrin repeat domain-containing protein 49-like [Amphibalanus amphitrite]XP_043216000.1 ankyrin repeat domain-containing protein 49-like [Amphibalanus amphitrite]XP_043216001.1 ankyrin repeat domain-containing protein 49-like [Amphibalanus amphitrite]